jgi:hypothetical protein
MEDLIEQANEIQESLGRSYYVADEVDEADLQAELDALGLDDELVGENETLPPGQHRAAGLCRRRARGGGGECGGGVRAGQSTRSLGVPPSAYPGERS